MTDIVDFGDLLNLHSLCEMVEVRHRRILLLSLSPEIEAAAILAKQLEAKVWLVGRTWTRLDYERLWQIGCPDLVHLVSDKNWMSLLPPESFDVILSGEAERVNLDHTRRLLVPGGMVAAVTLAMVREPGEIPWIRMMHEEGLFGVLGIDGALPKSVNSWRSEWARTPWILLEHADVPPQSPAILSKWISGVLVGAKNPSPWSSEDMTQHLFETGEITLLRLVARRLA